jgi:hypothetical protein
VLAILWGLITRRFQSSPNINVIKLRWVEHVTCIEQMRNVSIQIFVRITSRKRLFGCHKQRWVDSMWILTKLSGRVSIGFIWLRIRCCKHGYEYLGSIKCTECLILVKVKLCRWTPWRDMGEWRYTSTASQPWHQMVGGQLYDHAALARHPLNRRLNGTQRRSGSFGEEINLLNLPGI